MKKMNNPDTLPPRILVLGAGSMGANHIRLLAHSRISALAGIVEQNPATRQAFGKAHQVPTAEGLDEALSRIDFDAAIVATPTETHFALTRTLLEAGKHVLVEKPATVRAEEGYCLLEKAKAAGLVFMVGHVERFNPAILLLKEKLDSLGSIYHLECERTGPFPERVFQVGVGIDLLVHDVDLILMLTRLQPRWTFAHKERRVHPHREDGVTALLGFDKDIVAVLRADWLSPTKERRFRIYGHKGMFEVDFLSRSLRFFENSHAGPVEDNFGLVGMEEGDQIRFKTLPLEPLASELNYFVTRIKAGRLDAETEEMTATNIRTIEVVEKMLASAEREEKVRF